MVDIKYLVKDLIRTRKIQNFINNRLKDESILFLPKNNIKYICTNDAVFENSPLLYTLMQVESDYIFDDLNPEDIILDIGAGIGAFSLRVHQKVNHVYAIEPLWTNELLKNCELSNADNVTVLPYALSKDELSVEYEDRKANVEGKTLSEIKELCGGHVDFLKMDCEGGEWNIKPHELKGIRRIEAEIHSFNGENMNDFVKMLESCGFVVKKKKNACNNMLIHAWKV